jgi:hypothetical protein
MQNGKVNIVTGLKCVSLFKTFVILIIEIKPELYHFENNSLI